jgi:hypothetical protein
MTKDDRLYGRFTLDFADSPKIAPLSDAAFRALVEMTLHSRRMLDDGFVDERIAHRKWKKRVIEELCTNDTVKPSLFRVDGGYRIHDFGEHQQTRADIEKKREAGRAGGLARAQAHAKAPAEASPKLLTETESETETPSSTKKVGASRATRIPDPFMVSDRMRQWARDEVPGVDVDRATRMFVDHFRAASGPNSSKKDWVAAWRNWLRKDYGNLSPAQRSVSRPPKSNECEHRFVQGFCMWCSEREPT